MGLILVVFRLVRLWLGSFDTEKFGDHLGEVGLYSLIVITGVASIFGIGRGISGGWVGALAGAVA